MIRKSPRRISGREIHGLNKAREFGKPKPVGAEATSDFGVDYGEEGEEED